MATIIPFPSKEELKKIEKRKKLKQDNLTSKLKEFHAEGRDEYEEVRVCPKCGTISLGDFCSDVECSYYWLGFPKESKDGEPVLPF